jgi:hypothetical protein
MGGYKTRQASGKFQHYYLIVLINKQIACQQMQRIGSLESLFNIRGLDE